MHTIYAGDSSTLCQRLLNRSVDKDDCLLKEAHDRIKQLEDLCARMTDTGVFLEEEATELAAPHFWWVADEPEISGDSPEEVLKSLDDLVGGTSSQDVDIVELARCHNLPNSYAVRFSPLHDGSGRELHAGGCHEFHSYQEAEEAVADYAVRKRRAEGRL